MIRLECLEKIYHVKGQRKCVADGINAVFPRGVSVGLLGRNGAGKSTLLRMIAGTCKPTRGRIVVEGSISWPVGLSGSFHGDLTGAQNTRFVARVYGVDSDYLVDYVANFAELGMHFHLPVRTYSSGMRARLAFGLSMGVRFDTYLVDEVTSVGDALFKKKSEEIFAERMASAGAIVVTHSMPMIRRMCTMGAVLEAGQLTLFDTIDAAIAQHEANLGVGG